MRTAFESPEDFRAGARGSIYDGAGDEIVRLKANHARVASPGDALARRVGRRLSEDERRLVRFVIADLFASPDLRKRTLLLLVMSLTTIVGYLGVSTWVPQYAGQVAARAGHTAGRWDALAGLLYSVAGIAGYLVLGMLGDLWAGSQPSGCSSRDRWWSPRGSFPDRRSRPLPGRGHHRRLLHFGPVRVDDHVPAEVYPTAVRATRRGSGFNSARYLAAFASRGLVAVLQK